MKSLHTRKVLLIALASFTLLHSVVCAVTSQVTYHRSAADLLKGETENVIINSEGTIKLARKATEIDCTDLLEDVWIINTIVTDSDGNVYIGTSPNGDIIKYNSASGLAKKIYPLDDENTTPDQITEPSDPNQDTSLELFSNEHIFAMILDKSDKLLVDVSGSNPRLIKFEKDQPNTIFEFEDDSVIYIFDMVLDTKGNIYIATGPQGLIYRLDSSGKNPTLVYDSRDKNILSLAVGKDGFIYAGADQRGIVYKINPENQSATVLFDSAQTEITALVLDQEGNLYATATSDQAAKEQTQRAASAERQQQSSPQASQ